MYSAEWSLGDEEFMLE